LWTAKARFDLMNGEAPMNAFRIHRFGPPEVMSLEDVPKPMPSHGEVTVRIEAAGVGPWDALIRSGKSPATAAALNFRV
jgi:NADPH:quinone reductase-like Zn-dependent oxidoreductase